VISSLRYLEEFMIGISSIFTHVLFGMKLE